MVSQTKDRFLDGRTLWIPRMTGVGARLAAAVFRSVGVDARVTPPSDARTLELGGLHSSGDECYPQKVTLGDFLRIVYADDFDPDRTAFFMPTAEGPCRFGQYAPYLRQVLDELGHEQIPIVSPTSKNSYDGVAQYGTSMIRATWRSLVAGDIVRKLLLQTRPYEAEAGTTDQYYEASVRELERLFEQRQGGMRRQLADLRDALTDIRDGFRALPCHYTKDRPLIGVVGEIFCRLNTFSNDDAVRKIEAHGGEAWLSDVSEWVWYTNWSQKDILRREGKRFSLGMLGAHVKNAVQRHDEQKLLEPFATDLRGYEEPHDVYEQVLKPAWPYLPADGALGEMVLSVGKTIYLHGMGADGIIDISPFSCMNGIVTESIYHAVSRDHDKLPIRNFYFDASSSNMQRDLDIFMELAESYRRTKRVPRRYPPWFE